MYAFKTRVGDEPIPGRAKFLAEIHVLTHIESRIETANRQECVALNREIATT
jgi:hypothetical protein